MDPARVGLCPQSSIEMKFAYQLSARTWITGSTKADEGKSK
jgi:hypothetical protein